MPEAGGGKLIGFLNPDLTLGSGLDLAPYLLSYGREALGCKEGSRDTLLKRGCRMQPSPWDQVYLLIIEKKNRNINSEVMSTSPLFFSLQFMVLFLCQQ